MEKKRSKIKDFWMNHKKLCILLIIVILLSTLIGSCVVKIKQASEEMLAAMNQVQTAAVERRTLISSISATGKVASTSSKTVAANLSGVEITSMSVSVGDMVEAGTVLCEFDSEDIEKKLADAKASLAATSEKTKLDVEAAQRSLNEAQNNRNIELERMNKDVADAWTEYQKAVNELKEAKEKWDEAQINTGAKNGEYEYRSQRLEEARNRGEDTTALEQEVASWAGKVEAARQAESAAESAYNQAQTNMQSKLDAYEKQVRSQEDSIRNSDSTIASKTDSLTNSQLSATTSTLSDEQKVKDYQKQLEDCVLESPVSGVITAISAEAGDTYSGGTLFTIEDISSYEVSAEIDEYDIGKIEEGQSVVIKTNGTGDEEMEGRVIQIAPRATASTTAGATASSTVTYNVRIAIDTPNELLKLDMTAKLSIIQDSKENVLTVPYEAVQEDENGKHYVEVVEPAVSPDEQALGEEPQTGEVSATEVVTEEQKEGTPKIPEKEKAEEAAIPNGPMDSGENNDALSQPATRRIYVEKGIESDYYVEIISADIEEGMEVVLPKSQNDGLDIQMLMEYQGPMGGF